MSHFSILPDNATSTEVWSLTSELLPAWRALPHRVMSSPSEISNHDRSLIAAYYSALKGFKDHSSGEFPIARALGIQGAVDQDLFRQVLENPESAAIDRRLVPVLLYVRKLALESYKLLQRDVDSIFAAGWTERTLTDVVVICATMACHITVMMGHGVVATNQEDIGGVASVDPRQLGAGH